MAHSFAHELRSQGLPANSQNEENQQARKIRENHQNYNNSKEAVDNNYQSKDKSKGKQYIIARMVDTFGKKDNYHLNEVNIKYLPDALLLDKDNKGNHFRIRNVKHTKNRKDDVLSINILKDNDFNKDKLKVKLNYKPNIINNPEMTKYNNKNANITNNKNINDINNIISSNKNDNLIYRAGCRWRMDTWHHRSRLHQSLLSSDSGYLSP